MKILKEFEKITGVSRLIIKAGTFLAVFLVAAAIITITFPRGGVHEIILSEQMCTTAVTVFAQAVVFGIIGSVIKERMERM